MTATTDFYFNDYQQWREGLTQTCNIDLTPAYARSRIEALSDRNDPHTREFAAKYGDAYLKQVIQWFERAERGN